MCARSQCASVAVDSSAALYCGTYFWVLLATGRCCVLRDVLLGFSGPRTLAHTGSPGTSLPFVLLSRPPGSFVLLLSPTALPVSVRFLTSCGFQLSTLINLVYTSTSNQ